MQVAMPGLVIWLDSKNLSVCFAKWTFRAVIHICVFFLRLIRTSTFISDCSHAHPSWKKETRIKEGKERGKGRKGGREGGAMVCGSHYPGREGDQSYTLRWKQQRPVFLAWLCHPSLSQATQSCQVVRLKHFLHHLFLLAQNLKWLRDSYMSKSKLFHLALKNLVWFFVSFILFTYNTYLITYSFQTLSSNQTPYLSDIL